MKPSAGQITIFLIHPLVGWALCGAIMEIGLQLWSPKTALVVHVVGATVVFSIIAYIYFTKFRFTRPFTTAFLWVLFVVMMDFFVVALLINRSLAMFGSLLGTWIPFGVIFFSTYLIGSWVHGVPDREK